MIEHDMATIISWITAALSSLVSYASRPDASAQHASNQPQHQRRDAHYPKMCNEEEDNYILTLFKDKTHYDNMAELRKQWFPARLLKVQAHVTLFHTLPGSKLHDLKQDIAALAVQTNGFEIAVGQDDVFKMGKGVGINVSTKGGQREAAGIRAELRDKWEPFLSEQYQRKKWRGHYNVTNKEDDEERVKKCLYDLKTGFKGN